MRGLEVADGGVVPGASRRVAVPGSGAVEDDAHCVALPVGGNEHGTVDVGHGAEHVTAEQGRIDLQSLRREPVGFGGGVAVHDEHRAVLLGCCQPSQLPQAGGVLFASFGEQALDRVLELFPRHRRARKRRMSVLDSQQRDTCVVQFPGAAAGFVRRAGWQHDRPDAGPPFVRLRCDGVQVLSESGAEVLPREDGNGRDELVRCCANEVGGLVGTSSEMPSGGCCRFKARAAARTTC